MTKPTGRPRGRPRKTAHAQAHTDGWSNVLLGLGNVKTDPVSQTRYNPDAMLDHQTLTDIYRGDG
ncbi:MAG: hypothetical protein IBX56_20300, partial [Methylomicrobium sp.]|nr:hypothetical protein [Methylomicrobium sp.]